MAARVRVEEVVEHALHQQAGVGHAFVGGVEDFLKLVQHKEHPRLGRVGAGWHGKFAAEGVQQACKAGLLAKDLGNGLQPLGVGMGIGARAQQRGKAPRQTRDR